MGLNFKEILQHGRDDDLTGRRAGMDYDPFADPLAFSRFTDGILLVVEAEKTSKKDIARVMELLKGKPLIGAIYNKAKD